MKQTALRRAEEAQRWRQEHTIKAPEKPAIDRNDPCPCGSGKKFKRCCSGDNPTVHNAERQRRRAYIEDLYEKRSKVPEGETAEQRSQRVRALQLMAAYLGML